MQQPCKRISEYIIGPAGSRAMGSESVSRARASAECACIPVIAEHISMRHGTEWGIYSHDME